MLVLDEEHPQALPSKATFASTETLDFPTEYHPALKQVLQDHAMLSKRI